MNPLEEQPQPRRDHYVFVHNAMRGLAFADPLATLGALASPQAEPFLDAVLNQVREEAGEGELADFTATDVTIHRARVSGFPCATLELPEPVGVTEAHFVAVVLLRDRPPVEGESIPPEEVRYITLEKGVTFGGPPRTALCEWSADGSHLNYGDGPEPQIDAFLTKVSEMVLPNE